jgi:hypothetical protein
MTGEYLLWARDGDVYSVEEAGDWLRDSGWRILDHKTLAGPFSLLIAQAVKLFTAPQLWMTSGRLIVRSRRSSQPVHLTRVRLSDNLARYFVLALPLRVWHLGCSHWVGLRSRR